MDIRSIYGDGIGARWVIPVIRNMSNLNTLCIYKILFRRNFG
jgi:hypothetical protein